MIFEDRSSEKRGATALELNEGTFDGINYEECSQQQAAARFRLAITLRIPVGYQDATGFNYGTERGHQ